MVARLEPNVLAEALKIAVEVEPRYRLAVVITGGTILGTFRGQTELEFYCSRLNAIREKLQVWIPPPFRLTPRRMRGGKGCMIRVSEAVVRSKKDGYTLLYANTTAMVYSRIPNPEIVPYDPVKDLEPLGMHLWVPAALVVKEGSPWKTLSGYLDYAKKNPGKLTVAIHSAGSIEHFNLEIIKSLTDTQFNMIPFKGPAEAVTAMLGGHVDSTFIGLTLVLPHVKSEQMKILLTSRKWSELPDLPTITELGYKQELGAGWFAFYAPAGIPEEVKKVLVSAFERIARNPEMKSKIDKMGFSVDYRSPAELKRIMIEDFETAMAIAKKIGLQK